MGNYINVRDYDDGEEDEPKGLWTPKSLREVSPPTVASRLRCPEHGKQEVYCKGKARNRFVL